MRWIKFKAKKVLIQHQHQRRSEKNNQSVTVVTTNQQKTGVQLTPETSCISTTAHTTGSV